jgi:hypothetical protein
MRSTEMFRSHTLDHEQRRIDWWWGAVAVIAVATVYGVVGEADARREQALLQASKAREQREVALNSEHLVELRAAYQHGLDEGSERGCAIADVRRQP